MAERSLRWLTDLFAGAVDEPKVETSIGPIYPTPDGKPISSSAVDVTRLKPIKNWSHPFKQNNKVSAIDQLTQLANATAGYYPLGAGGLWHGGVHFDSGTAGVLDQSSVVCIADGEVVAYRTDMNSAVTNYVQNKKPMPKPFSRNFVLVRHRLEAPRIQGNDNSPPSLIIYSLYMHLEDGAVYQSTPTVARPGFWEKKDDYIVPMTAKDVDPDQPGKLGLNVRHQEKGGAVIDLLLQGALVRVSGEGAYRRLENMKGPERLVDTDGVLLGYVRFDQLEPAEGGEYRAKAGLTIYDEINSKRSVRRPGLPKGALVKISGEGELRKLESIAQFVHFGSLQALPVPRAHDEICVLDKPLPIKAGALIGHIGRYQDYAAAQPEKKLHLEVFSDGDVECFINQCRSWEKALPAKDKTWLKLAKGTVVVVHKDYFGEKRPPTQNDERQLSDADLSVLKSLLDGLPSTHKIAASEAGGRKACNWYRLEGLLNNEKNQLLDGWVRVEDDVEQWTSPWAWEGYEVITDYTSPPEFTAASLRSLKRLTEEQLRRYGPMADAGDKGPIKERLFDLIDRDGDRNITVEELRAVMRIPAHAQALSRLIIYCESEWYYKSQKWDVLDEMLGHAGSTPHVNWLAERLRIEQLSWWSGVIDELGLPVDGKVSHFHSVGLLGRFMSVKTSPEILIGKARVRLEFLDLYDGSVIEEEDYVEAAATLGCEVEAIKAVALTETGSVGSYFGGAESDKVAAILFERHYFHQLTGGRFDQSDPDISSSKSGGYGVESAQYGKLVRAYNLSASEALKSASWGRFQIMGRYHVNAGYSSVEDFVRNINRSEKNHLKAFVNFIKFSSALSSAIIQKNWLRFALEYNGPRQKGYDEKMRKNYEALKGL